MAAKAKMIATRLPQELARALYIKAFDEERSISKVVEDLLIKGITCETVHNPESDNDQFESEDLIKESL